MADVDSARRSRCSESGSAASTAKRGSELKLTDATQARLAPCLRRKCLAPRARRRGLGGPQASKAGRRQPASELKQDRLGRGATGVSPSAPWPETPRGEKGKERCGRHHCGCRAEARADFGGPGGRDHCCAGHAIFELLRNKKLKLEKKKRVTTEICISAAKRGGSESSCLDGLPISC